MKTLCMGNEAIARGAIKAGVGIVTGYPGTPSTEILETVARLNKGDIYVEWSVNEKVALEVAAGAAYTGKRAMVTMKQVGLNVASDPLMSLAYIGIKGGMVVVVADDPGPISSQTEQDTRQFAIFAKLPVFDPTTPEEAYEMMQDAFLYSEQYGTPVIFRPTTRVCHSYVDLEDKEGGCLQAKGSFEKDAKWVIFPKLTYKSHLQIESRNEKLKDTLSQYRFNELIGKGKKGILVGGVSATYIKEILRDIQGEYKLLKVVTPHPFPEALALEFLAGLDEVLVIEELDPVLEREILMLCGKHHLPVSVKGKLTHHISRAGENSIDVLKPIVYDFLKMDFKQEEDVVLPILPIRPPVLCAGCPHRASFYAVKQAMKGKRAVFSGDIGCYTLGNAMPLDMVDTCLCMGAGITVAQGLERGEKEGMHFAFIGDSTFFHTGIPGIINAIYNQTDLVIVVLDNATTAMTGNQPHPGLGTTMMQEVSRKISIEKVVTALGVSFVKKLNPYDQQRAKDVVRQAAEVKGVRVILFEAPCKAVSKPKQPLYVDEQQCKGCKQCVRELGCPALIINGNYMGIERKLCTGCGLCQSVCKFQAIGGMKNE